MQLIKECRYDNTDLTYWDVVIFQEWGYRLGMVKSTYHDSNTDCSWHYIQTSEWWKEFDMQWDDILYKLVWDEAEIIKNMILTWEIKEDSELKKIKLKNELDYYKEELQKIENRIWMYKEHIEEIEKELEKY